METLRSFPAIGKDEMIRYFTLASVRAARRPALGGCVRAGLDERGHRPLRRRGTDDPSMVDI
ncbi:hypothetical protein FHS39_002756 [Streptomyces olivoverticillatus]|uniref:Uncharacterized protein n=1 Tax=Streptomyces olivoverticillatus TaxID=66427 RepID=A0A7W7LNY5_9ACTN|nr:hypothetical protein [Streptomyces olivoverticillatus]MBB4893725.1 hypothetical protein [Streptomyces olivoverticillatus]